MTPPRQQLAVFPCATCSHPVRPSPCRLRRNKHHFCNDSCARSFRRPPPPRTRVTVSCSWCRRPVERHPYRLKVSPRHYCNFECRTAWRRAHLSGENSWAWRGGRVYYYGPNWHVQRARARRRDNYTCRRCHRTEYELQETLHVHHVTPFRTFRYRAGVNTNYRAANRLRNLLTLCCSCHKTVEP
jgi:hypothetical protein